MQLSVVIPIHNEEPSILPLYDRLTAVLERENPENLPGKDPKKKESTADERMLKRALFIRTLVRG
jgi:hypothetical protein